jgi:Uma2 family endonuclease
MAQKTKAAPITKLVAKSPFPDGEEPTWEVAFLFPPQGGWTEFEYFNLDRFCDGIPRIELSNGRLEVLPMPTQIHQLITFYLAKLLDAFAAAHAPGVVLPSGMRLRLRSGKFRDVDVCYMKAENAHRRHTRFWEGADLVMEVVSGDANDVKRDWENKVRDYARTGIPEYWIVDPEKKVIRVLTLHGKSYKVHGDFGPGTKATSVLLPGFSVSVDEVLAAGGNVEEE